jgi:hypothetical protein
MAKRPKKTPAGEYDVGYGKPPRHSQFQPGQPRPPRRPKKPVLPDMDTFLCEELSHMVEVPGRDGRTERLPMGRLLVRQMVTKAAKTGDLSQVWPKLPKSAVEPDAPFSEVELAIVLRALRRAVENNKGAPPVAPEDEDEGEA